MSMSLSSVAGLNLKKKVFSAGAWSLASYFFNYAFRLGSNLLMTRLLLPETFGIMAVAMVVITGLVLFSDVGLRPNVVRNERGDDRSFLNTAWVIQIVRGFILSLGALIIAFIIAIANKVGLVPAGSVYADPALPYVVCGLSLFPLIGGFESTKSLQAYRSLQLAKLTRMDIAAQVLSFLVTASWAISYPSIWALIAGTVAGVAVRAALSHVWLPGHSNRLQWERRAFVEIIHFGKWIFLSTILFFVASNGDRLMLGAMIDPASLGAYSIAFLIFTSVDQILSKAIVDVSFPALSELIRESRPRFQKAYYRFHFAIASFSYFAAGSLLVSGSSIIAILYDRRYQQAGWMLELLAVALMVQPYRLATQTFLALGLEKIYFQLHATRICVLFLALPIGFYVAGLEGAVCGVVLSYFASLPQIWKHARSSDLLDLKKELLPLPALIVGIGCGELFKVAVGAFLAH